MTDLTNNSGGSPVILIALLFAASLWALWAGFKGYTPADFDHFEVDHHDNKDGVLTWTEK